ncbi:hypothetical protein OCK74_13865 [Chitinophagaceae bacterium LB-8]|jgi:hypothetical protein|uniref:Uncharacterized protein n=1 Tax=Paraflavisolibacter caeni TaxID=2982496 RepID=A0A9X2XVN3_9BACT|nr:hypothetical protein [Paraflavisolibacter caeni]MCU7550204.1 hypothetical protein [Paraflavisolibacter caeni]
MLYIFETFTSGIGVYRNWNSDGPTMPQVYEAAIFQEAITMT